MGCTDPEADNYQPLAAVDDASCVYGGCLVIGAPTYNPSATFDDGSCGALSFGCTASLASNYVPGAMIDDGSCIYSRGSATTGCSNPAADNYVSNAVQLAFANAATDSPCVFFGCTDSRASNYDAHATADNGSCIAQRAGCTDSLAVNFQASYTRPCSPLDDRCAGCQYGGCTLSDNPHYHTRATFDDGSCAPVVRGCTASTAVNFFPSATTDDGSCAYGGCTNSASISYDGSASFDDGSCSPVIHGCMRSDADNFRADATHEDGSCTVVGCTDSSAIDFDANANHDNGLCTFSSPPASASPTSPPLPPPLPPPQPSGPLDPPPFTSTPLDSPPAVPAPKAPLLITEPVNDLADEGIQGVTAGVILSATLVFLFVAIVYGCFAGFLWHPTKGSKSTAPSSLQSSVSNSTNSANGASVGSASFKINPLLRLQFDRSGSTAITARATAREDAPPDLPSPRGWLDLNFRFPAHFADPGSASPWLPGDPPNNHSSYVDQLDTLPHMQYLPNYARPGMPGFPSGHSIDDVFAARPTGGQALAHAPSFAVDYLPNYEEPPTSDASVIAYLPNYEEPESPDADADADFADNSHFFVERMSSVEYLPNYDEPPEDHHMDDPAECIGESASEMSRADSGAVFYAANYLEPDDDHDVH